MAFFPRMYDPNPDQPQYADYEEEAADLAKRRALADALVNRGLFSEERDQGRMVGGRFIRPSMAGGIQRGIGALAGLHMGKEASKDIRSLRGRQQEAIGEWMKPLVEGVQERKPFVAPGFDEADVAATSQGLQTAQQRPMTKGELLGHYMKGTSLGGPAAAISAKGMEGLLAQQSKTPKWEIQERYNPETGRKEKAWVDMNAGPGGPNVAFGGQSQPDQTEALKKMRELVNMGMPQQIAEGIAYGYLSLGQNADGSTVLIDRRRAAMEGGMGGVPPGATPGIAPPGAGAAPPQMPSQAPQMPPQGAQMPAPGAVPPQPVPQPTAAPGPQAGPVSPYAQPARVPGQVGAAPPSPKPGIRLEADTQQMSKELETKMVPATLEGIKEVTKLIDDLGLKRSGRSGAVAGDVPGFGVIPSLLPNWAVTEKGKNMRGAAANVANKLLQAQSGLAVTDQENARFLKQLQQGALMTDQDFLTGWQRVLNEVEGRLGNIKGGYHPDVVGEYSRRNPKNVFSVPRPRIFGGGGADAPENKANPADEFF